MVSRDDQRRALIGHVAARAFFSLAGRRPTISGSSGRAIGCRLAAHLIARGPRVLESRFPVRPFVVSTGNPPSLLRPPCVSRRVIPRLMGLTLAFLQSQQQPSCEGGGVERDQFGFHRADSLFFLSRAEMATDGNA